MKLKITIIVGFAVLALLSGCDSECKHVEFFTNGSPVEKAANTIGACLIMSALIRGALSK